MGEREGTTDTLITYEQLREGLPFSSDVNLGHIVRLMPEDTSVDQIREQMLNRFIYFQYLHEQLGLDFQPEIEFGQALALVDEDVFEKVVKEIREDGEDKEVADHEIGHSIVAEGLGWVTKSITVTPGSSYRGLTEAVPQTNLAFDDFALHFAAICYGGATAAAIMGNKVRGEGSDIAKARALARAVVNNPYSKFMSEDGFLKQAQGLAHNALSRHGASGIHSQAKRLFREKTIV